MSPFVEQSLKAWQEVQVSAKPDQGLSRWPKDHAASAMRQDAAAAACADVANPQTAAASMGGPVPPKRDFVKAHDAQEQAANKQVPAAASASRKRAPGRTSQDSREDYGSVPAQRRSTSSRHDSKPLSAATGWASPPVAKTPEAAVVCIPGGQSALRNHAQQITTQLQHDVLTAVQSLRNLNARCKTIWDAVVHQQWFWTLGTAVIYP